MCAHCTEPVKSYVFSISARNRFVIKDEPRQDFPLHWKKRKIDTLNVRCALAIAPQFMWCSVFTPALEVTYIQCVKLEASHVLHF